MSGPWPELTIREVVHDGPRTTLYRAMRASDGAGIILKVLKPGFDDAIYRGRLEHEYAVAKNVDGSFAVRALGLTTYEGRPALILEDSAGESLDRTLAKRPSLDVLLPIAVRIAASIAGIHRQGILHKDIKPSNLIHLPKTGDVLLTDFGIAATRVEGAARPNGALEGTLAYMAPEQTGRMRRGVDHRADLYSFGMTLYELFTGERPFHARDALEWTHCHIARVPRPLTEIVPELPPVLSSIVLRLLAKAPEERYQSAEGVLRDLERCRDEWEDSQKISAFRIGELDLSNEFRIPERIYGRDRELDLLRGAFDRAVAVNGTELVLVSGYSGIGKSCLVRELQSPTAEKGGFFASGKFDQYRRHVPYSAFAQAGRELVQQILAASGERLAAWKKALGNALGTNGRVLADVVPEIELVLGPQPDVIPLPPTETQNRFHFAVRAFLGAFSVPIVLFLDDMQWADQASLALLDAIFVDRARGAFLCVLSYRENEVGPEHPFRASIARIRRGAAPVESITLGNLDGETVGAIVAETLRANPASCDALTSFVMAKTEGNPFFVNELLRTLHLNGLLQFDPASRAWRFDLSEVEAKAISDNVVHLMIGRLQRLSPTQQEVLRLAACIGSEFDLDDLAAVMQRPLDDIAIELEGPIAQGLVFVQADAEQRPEGRFRHDRIQQAAYALIHESARAEAHLRIGRVLWGRIDGDSRASKIFDVANHLDVAFPLMTDPEERERLLDLETSAAKRAKNATAYAQARRYLARAAELLTEEGWTSQYARTFDVHVDLAECEYLGGRLEEARTLFAKLLERAQSKLDRARIYYLQIRLFQVAGDFAEAAALSLRSFELFGLSLPSTDAEGARAVEEENRIAVELLGDRPIADHIALPPMRDPEVRMLVGLLEASGPPLYMVKPSLFPWIALKLVNSSLRHGNAEASCYGYGIYALLRAAAMNDVEGGYAFCQLAIRLNEKLGDVKLAGCMLHLLGDHVNFWRNPIATDLPILARGFDECVRGGDHIYSNYIGFQAPWHLYESGAPLGDVLALTEKYASFALETKYVPVHLTIRLEQEFVRALKHGTRERGAGLAPQIAREEPPEDRGPPFDEAEALAEITKARFGCGIVYCHILKLVERYTYGDYEGALTSAKQAEPELGSAFSMPIYVTYGFYRALTLAALHPYADPETQARHLQEMSAHHEAMTSWARACPANFAHKASLLGAEIARVSGQTALAMRLYEESRLAARAQGFVHYEALACELAASLYASAGVASVARALLADARTLYARWGALGKASALRSQHRSLDSADDGREAREIETRTEGLTTGTTSRHLDVLPVVKAAQSLSAEIVLPRLLERLMSIVIEYAGATRGWLVLLEGNELVVSAQADTNRSRLVATSPSTRAESTFPSVRLPESILNYVRRTGEHVLLDDAKVANLFAHDPHFERSAHRSVLCKPIARQGRFVGMFYLENDLVAGAFGPERLAILEVLASQTAISIENSRLYEASQAAVIARDEFLAIASHELRTPLTPLTLQLHSLISAIRKGTLREMPEERLNKLVATCDAQLARLTRLIEALLDVSRIGAGKLVLQREQVDLGNLVSRIVERHAHEIARAECALDLKIDDGVVGYWDRMRIELAITNLVLNAIKFGGRKPVEIRVSGLGDLARVEVTDHGIGIGEEDMGRIFQRFERVQSKHNVDGLGLGLFIVRAIVMAHDGRITVDSRPDEGSTFRIEIPVEERMPLSLSDLRTNAQA